MNADNRRPLVLIVGGGLVGSLNALYFAKTNKFDVVLCEKRNDFRQDIKVVGRSINLSVSDRARSALREIGLEEDVLKFAIPMFGRMIHNQDGSLRRIPYGKDDQCIMAVDRRYLNECLLTRAEKCDNVTIKFNHNLVNLNLKSNVATFKIGDEIVQLMFDFLIGNDGANSAVRQQMMKYMRLDFSQEYIPHGYMELYFPPGENNSFTMHQNCLHIWPRNDFMLIGLPNPGGSFTGTLFMPFDIFKSLQSSDDVINFFEHNFPDALKLIGRSSLIETFTSNRPSNMVTIRCGPYNYEDSCVLMGDAAHAMVPFFGQGMNAGFEDIIIFHEILRETDFDLGRSCSLFTERRNADAKAICELAFFNYIELRKTVNNKSFLIRKYFDNLMNRLFPKFWIPLYTMVTFSRTPYTKCIQERRKQDKIIKFLGYTSTALVAGACYLGYYFFARDCYKWLENLGFMQRNN